MGTLTGTQGLRGSMVATTSPAPTQVSGAPADDLKGKGAGTDETAADPKRHPTQDAASPPQRRQYRRLRIDLRIDLRLR